MNIRIPYGSSLTDRHPDFSDEFHLRLPLALNKKHHLLFTFVHIQCKEGSKSKNQANVESLIGYSVLPLIHDGVTTVRSGTFDLPIATCEQAFYRYVWPVSGPPFCTPMFWSPIPMRGGSSLVLNGP